MRQRRERLAIRVDPERVFEVLYSEASCAFWLDAGILRTGSSYLGDASPTRPGLLVDGEQLFRLARGERTPQEGTLDEALRAWSTRWGATEDGGAGRSPLGWVGRSPLGWVGRSPLGWVGWLGYEYGARRLGIPTCASPYPDAVMLAADRVVEVDHVTGEPCLWFLDDDGGRSWAAATAQRLLGLSSPHGNAAEGSGGGLPAVPSPSDAPVWRHSDADYLQMIQACQASIRSGDAYQLCLTNTVSVATAAHPFDVYRRMRRISRAVHGAYLRVGDVAVCSASPELFLRVRDGEVVTRPVKGTRRRGSDARDDAALVCELARNEKERAENLMIVDLMRNDLGRFARLGSVSVPELLKVETHEHVHQLVSTVRADLADDADALEAIHACFPAGSMTGAPKLSAMSILRELEKGPRGIYGGCVGRLGLDGSAELAMGIRTVVMSGGTATIGTGGGITALSIPEEELAEARLKAEGPLSALGA